MIPLRITCNLKMNPDGLFDSFRKEALLRII
jgi:hypothetical protein